MVMILLLLLMIRMMIPSDEYGFLFEKWFGYSSHQCPLTTQLLPKRNAIVVPYDDAISELNMYWVFRH